MHYATLRSLRFEAFLAAAAFPIPPLHFVVLAPARCLRSQSIAAFKQH